MESYVECLLQVIGNATDLNTFDKQFRSGTGPQWTDRPHTEIPCYSLHALFPVPDEVQSRGYQTAGHLWCKDFWNVSDDLVHMQVKRLPGERRYRFYTPVDAPKNVFRKVS